MCHAPRERVSWNKIQDVRCKALRVTLHVSVWVEIEKFGHASRAHWSRSTWACELKCKNMENPSNTRSHAPRERVSWNENIYNFYTSWNGHAPRERVSWNA